VNRIRSGAGRSRQQPRIGAPDRSLTPNAGMAVISELCGRLGVIGALDAAVGPIKQRERGFGAGELLTGIAAAQLAGEDFLTGLDSRGSGHVMIRSNAGVAHYAGLTTRGVDLGLPGLLGQDSRHPRSPPRGTGQATAA
jgi:hypothetical protein